MSMASDDMKRIEKDGDLRVFIQNIESLEDGSLKFNFQFMCVSPISAGTGEDRCPSHPPMGKAVPGGQPGAEGGSRPWLAARCHSSRFQGARGVREGGRGL